MCFEALIDGNSQKSEALNTSILHREKIQILEALYIKINKPSLNKINFKYCSHIL